MIAMKSIPALYRELQGRTGLQRNRFTKGKFRKLLNIRKKMTPRQSRGKFHKTSDQSQLHESETETSWMTLTYLKTPMKGIAVLNTEPRALAALQPLRGLPGRVGSCSRLVQNVLGRLIFSLIHAFYQHLALWIHSLSY